MNYKKYISIILSATLIFVCLPFSVQAETIPDGAEYVEGEIMIVSTKEIEDSHGALKTASCSDVIDLDFDDVGIDEIEQLEECDPEDEKVYVAEIDGDVEDICKELNKYDDIIAEPNYIYHTAAFTLPYDVTRTGGVYENHQKSYFDTILHIPSAWQEHEATGEGVTVAVIDNGFFYQGVDAPAHLWRDANGYVGYNAYNTSSHDIGPVTGKNGAELEDSGHGSNVAGIIGMKADGANGIGVAYNAELMLIKVGYYSSGNYSSIDADALYRGIQFARNNGADILNISLGGTSLSNSIKLAVEGAYNDGITVIAAAGNYGSTTPYYPAAYSCVIGVMATDNTSHPSRLADFSNYETGSGYYNIAAPGCSILGCNYTASGLLPMSGTSQAAPIVAGCAALYKSLYPSCTADDIYEALIESSTDRVTSNPTRSPNRTYYYPLLDAQKLMNYVHEEPVPEPQLVINTLTTASPHDGYLYGLDEGFTDIGHYISIAEGTGSMTFIPNENGNGTGSTVNMYDINGTLRRTLTVIIFGDINGDCFTDGEDAVILRAYNSSVTELSDAQIFAADVNFDNQVTEVDEPFVSMGETYYLPSDFTIISQYAIGDNYISQVK